MAAAPPLSTNCPACGRGFEVGINVEFGEGGSVKAQRVNITTECPHCKQQVVVSKGPVEVSARGWRDLAEALRPEGVTTADYTLLAEVLSSATERGLSGEEVAADIAAQVPIFGGLGNWMLSPQGAALAGWIAVLLMVIEGIMRITYGLSGPDTTPAQPPVVHVDVTVQIEPPPSDVVEQEIARVLSERGINREDPCPCGSGRKYKRCHRPGG